jgi:hypothetical protein
MKIQVLIFIIVVIILIGCSQTTQTGNPDWVDQLIQKIESDPVGTPPLSIWRYEYNGQVVYFIPAHCCDIPSSVYNVDGNFLCASDGGITGEGDGRCKGFFTDRAKEMLIWQDPR